MSEEEITHIFKEGYSLKSDDGRGFGLFLVKEIVEANKGVIHIHSELGVGTTVEVEIQHIKGVEK